MDIEQRAREYLSAFQNRDIIELETFFSESVKLTDWDQTAVGRQKVLEANSHIFDQFNKINLEITNAVKSKNQIAIEFDLTLKSDIETICLPVVDIIQFDDKLDISMIRAYRGN